MRDVCAISALAILAGAATAEVPTKWSYQLQARSSLDAGIPAFNLPMFSSLSSQYVTLDEDGGVAVRLFISGNPNEGVFYGKDGTGGVVVSGFGVDPIWSTTCDLRNGMFVIEQGSFDDGAELYDTMGNLITTFTPGGNEGTSGFSSVTLTSDGAICYRGDFGFAVDKIVIDEFNPTRNQTLVASTASGYDFLFAPEINDARQVVFNSIPSSGPSRRIVRVEPDLSPTTIAETGGVWNSFVNSVAIAQSGHVGFSARRSADSVWEVIADDGVTTTVIADGNDPDISNSSLINFPPAVNSDGWVVFRATDTSNNSTAIWVGDGDNIVKLAEFDQMIQTDLGLIPLGFDFGGTTGRQVANGVVDINDSGQVAFAAFLRNGTIGVFVATPDDQCEVDFTNDGELDFFDLSAFLMALSNEHPSSDFSGDGEYDFFDVSAFLQAFAEGCP